MKENDIDTIKTWIDGKKPIDRYVDFRHGYFEDKDAYVNKKGMTALHYAAFYSKMDVVKLLLEADAGNNVVCDTSILIY